MTQKSGPFATGAGFNLGQDDMIDVLGPMLQGDGVNTTTYGGSSVQVYGSSSGLQVFVRAGSACSRGLMYFNTADVALAISANGSGSARIDRVVLRNDRGHSGGGQITPVVITGTPSATPVAPAYQQNVGGVWDIPLAQVRVAAGAAGISPGDVSDERQYMPLHVGVCDTSLPLFTPPVDGSAGRVFYDKNPAVMDLVVTDGATWRTVANQDSTWQNVAFDNDRWINAGFGNRYRKVGPSVEVHATVQGTGATIVRQMFTLPPGCRPVDPRTFPIATQDGASYDPNVTVSTAGVVSLFAGWTTTGAVTEAPALGRTFDFSLHFLAG